MATEGIFPFSVHSVVEDVLRQHGTRKRGIDLASRKADEAALRRYEAAGWLQKTVGAVGGKDLPAEPSEEEFRLGLRSGIILCNALNKVQPGAVSKVVESPCDLVLIPDGAALSAFQYFENVRNFLVAVQEMGLPTFEASDLNQGGKSARIVDCILALKSYSDWKEAGGNGQWKYGGNSTTYGKSFLRKNSEPFTNSFSKNLSINDRSLDGLSTDQNGDPANDHTEMNTTRSLNMLVRSVFSDKKPEEVPMLVESMLSKVVEEFECRLASQNELMKTTLKDVANSDDSRSLLKTSSGEMKKMKLEDESIINMMKDEFSDEKSEDDKESESSIVKQQVLLDQKERDIEMKVEDESIVNLKKDKFSNEKYQDDEKPKGRLVKQQVLLDQQQRDIKELRQTLETTRVGMQVMQVKYSEEFTNLGKYIHNLAHAASRYHKVLEENRKLYNQLQDLKGSIRVYCRVRPFLPGQNNSMSVVDNIEEGNITIITPSKYGKEGRRSFNFNKVFGPFASQEEVFSDTQPLIRSVLDGYNVCIFAYGQTGSGKTYTMTGPKELTEEGRGVNYRALNDLFLLSEQRKDSFSYAISVQMMEIYNEQVRDLLSTDGVNKKLEIRKSSQNGLSVPDANIVPVASTTDVIELMNLGHRNRAVSATALNDRSSRSHSCLTVHVQGTELTSGTTIRGCMHLVDLAGSERVDKAEVIGDRLKEAQHINKSLSALGDVIASLAQKNSHVPYRNSKLTQLLQDSLGGQAKTLMFVHISPEPDAIGETISTLKFAERVATVELGAARVNKDGADVNELKQQVAGLKAALARKSGEPGRHQRSMSSSPGRQRTKAGGSSPVGDTSGGHNNRRQPMEDVGNIEVQNNFVMKSKRASFDFHDISNSAPWQAVNSPIPNYPTDDEKEAGYKDWVSKQEPANQNENTLGQLPELFHQRVSPDSKVFPEQSCNRLTTTDDSDEPEAAACDYSSEPDLLWQSNLPKISMINNAGSKMNKSPKLAKSPEPRSSIPMPGPSPSRKLSNGAGPPRGRQSVSADGKRRKGNGK
ncbi:PREDICTED: kinesin-like protein KIN-14G isoform X2 [Nelumbo nucifera]|uniref:Kinesin-like protein KIN-14G isoform X2 n=2 Tax=Nelumbo nucifera TaxID=4432 RepID=A0A1U8Q668_NELNU|nr:PREDICTED: kinesin-like protein KIN-14G isoform X2 [Nelumbo nucifera]DAD38168.1 TPA_asm: hypothetical protein HUJ06_008809 [Nelumbo nucifera]